MKKIVSIYIDHAGNKGHYDEPFAQKIKDRLLSIKEQFEIRTFSDLNSTDNSWERNTSEAVDNADIIIPIISPDYLKYLSPVEEKFNSIIESKNKYLLPILYRPSVWVSYNWLVRSKLIPEDDKAITEHSEKEVDSFINGLVRTVADIITTFQTKPANKPKKISHIASTNEKIVFISHDHEDGDFAELLKLQLEKNGIKGWIDSERLKIGQDWREEIDEGISNSLALIAIMTPESRKSEFVTYEWAFGWGKGIKIFPLMLKQTQLHPRLESLQYLDFTKRNSRPYDKLIESIKELMDN